MKPIIPIWIRAIGPDWSQEPTIQMLRGSGRTQTASQVLLRPPYGLREKDDRYNRGQQRVQFPTRHGHTLPGAQDEALHLSAPNPDHMAPTDEVIPRTRIPPCATRTDVPYIPSPSHRELAGWILSGGADSIDHLAVAQRMPPCLARHYVRELPANLGTEYLKSELVMRVLL